MMDTRLISHEQSALNSAGEHIVASPILPLVIHYGTHPLARQTHPLLAGIDPMRLLVSPAV